MSRNRSCIIGLLLVALMPSLCTFAQPVSKVVLVEHFTNTHCSVCASRNPGFHQNLAQFPQVLHIAYYPSAPYPACPLNQYNKTEADARTKYYGVYGSTPRIVIQGIPVSAGTDYSNNVIFQSVLGATTSFAASLDFKMLGVDSAEVRFMVRKMDTSYLDSLSLYVAIAEDTFVFNAANGEQSHYNVFRKSAWGASPLRVKAPVNTGDSIVIRATVVVDPLWPLSRIHSVGIVQQHSGALLQVVKSGRLNGMTPLPVDMSVRAIKLYPNPVKDIIHFENAFGSTLIITDILGKRVAAYAVDRSETIQFCDLPSGQYICSLIQGKTRKQFLITKL